MSRTIKFKNDMKLARPKYVSSKNKGVLSFVPESDGIGITKTNKLIVKNANRSFKKSARQEAKNIIKKELEK